MSCCHPLTQGFYPKLGKDWDHPPTMTFLFTAGFSTDFEISTNIDSHIIGPSPLNHPNLEVSLTPFSSRSPGTSYDGWAEPLQNPFPPHNLVISLWDQASVPVTIGRSIDRPPQRFPSLVRLMNFGPSFIFAPWDSSLCPIPVVQT